MALLGTSIPDLSGDRQLVISSANSIKREEDDVGARQELFSRTEKPKRRVLDDEVSTNTSLDKMKQELFATPTKKKEKQQHPAQNKSTNEEQRNELFAVEPKKPKKPIIEEKKEEEHEVVDLDTFKAQLLGEHAAYFPDAPAESDGNTPKEPEHGHDDDALRSELFSVPSNQKEELDEFIDELPDNCTLHEAPSMRTTHISEADLPDPETLKGADFLDDDDLL